MQGWLDLFDSAEEAGPPCADVSDALAWIKDQAEQLRDERLAPFSEYSARIWADLRQESNVDLGPIAFSGSGRTRRKLDIPVRIDGADGGVSMLSNGELHALGLALFLPRSTAPESPFRFVVIDDPVQAMDPTKVEGLAQVLHHAAADRQVIVMTHDERLPDALRRLMLPATILEVTRREGSQVEIVPNQDPVLRYLGDACQFAHQLPARRPRCHRRHRKLP